MHKGNLPYKQRVTGSNPVVPTTKEAFQILKGFFVFMPYFIIRKENPLFILNFTQEKRPNITFKLYWGVKPLGGWFLFLIYGYFVDASL